ncbi:sensory protein TspO [Erwinia sp. OLTSP20]|uniref:tryptophan-rich sensory protein TspO n=1 Tax=unclassified Erwinia TaxID=2622719 RepID=UPI000C183FB5|nr:MULTISPECIES: TspO/MBR family protein [unclassified Erwinia]PIJ50368.1 sensory protein TspO [Erwinia sp. OAMSP11]PIJ71627.1 sensory protein TspO [Erwinia sp. OLSSP12]PIJ81011.1 sensory protein TspO [Erwinia sp. OLCASP19]PIJ83269.1 sensory protein TspO [Erwinia sp. OLMTSP26]PIJ85949.1 sensory protein TspO [Erwinia sp. OLMDSP33]
MTFFLFLFACIAAGSTGMIFKPGHWYTTLKKPAFTPPDWAFPLSWSLIYLLLAWAGYRLTQQPGSATLLALWALQITLNTLWSPLFFGAHRLRSAMTVLLALWLVVAAMIALALPLDSLSALLLLPYLLWLSLACALNFSILCHNRS